MINTGVQVGPSAGHPWASAGSAAGSLQQGPQASTGLSVTAEITLQVGAAWRDLLGERKKERKEKNEDKRKREKFAVVQNEKRN